MLTLSLSWGLRSSAGFVSVIVETLLSVDFLKKMIMSAGQQYSLGQNLLITDRKKMWTDNVRNPAF